jgi:methionyl-tRNA formyltransferase
LLVRTIAGLVAGTLTATPQENPTGLRHAPKIFTETCRIDWTRTTDEIYNLIRGLSPFPAAFTTLDGKLLKIYRSEKEKPSTPPTAPSAASAPSAPIPVPGAPDTAEKAYLRFATADGHIRVTELQLEGKKKMNAADFLRGYKPPRQ